MIIISASGMLTGGRILHHLEAHGPDPKNALVLSGYQAGGTRGATLAAGARELRTFGQDVPMKAEVVQIEGFSAHVDSNEIVRWMRTASHAPRMTYIMHGEPIRRTPCVSASSENLAGPSASRIPRSNPAREPALKTAVPPTQTQEADDGSLRTRKEDVGSDNPPTGVR
ncbi:MBL fold metallo-hydrolase RNA specificity domain-containing protein [Arthrobacter sp. efr-133-TYG-104]|uniref:MBL fold metallo-hydrolase RNA specificity domain-containing protein n=1 Tax=Arthrobacter sp. efr-133-TYG-104 TaxID=3040324 RepID=UPI0033057D17